MFSSESMSGINNSDNAGCYISQRHRAKISYAFLKLATNF